MQHSNIHVSTSKSYHIHEKAFIIQFKKRGKLVTYMEKHSLEG